MGAHSLSDGMPGMPRSFAKAPSWIAPPAGIRLMSSQCAAMMESTAAQRAMASAIVRSSFTPRPSSENPMTRCARPAMSVSSPSPFWPMVIDA